MTFGPVKFKLERESLITHGKDAKTHIEPPSDIAEQLIKRSQALFKQYKLEQGDWMSLALALALKHEPNFQYVVDDVSKKKTKDMAWTPILHLFLWWDVTEFKSSNSVPIDTAVFRVSKLPEWYNYKINRSEFYRAKESPFVESLMNLEKALGRDAVRDSMLGFLKNRKEIILDIFNATNIK
jgi:hypothetical protein